MKIDQLRKAPLGQLERRATSSPLALNPDSGLVTGYPVVFGPLSEGARRLRERVAPTALDRTLKSGRDVRAFFNHESSMVLGRQSNGTLRMRPDSQGLAVEIDLPETQWAQDLRTSMKRGDINQMSFGFYVASRDGEEWEGLDGSGPIVRTLKDIELIEVSVVSIPAYPDTTAAARSLADNRLALSRGRLKDCRFWQVETKRG